MKTTTRIIALLVALSFVLSGCDSSTSKIPEENLQSSGDFDVPTEQTDGQGKPVVGKVSDILVVDAGRQQFSDPNLLVKLRGAVTSKADGLPTPSKAIWTQEDDGAPRAFIVSPNQLETLVLAPDVKERTKLTFRLTGSNSLDNTSWDTTSLYVSPSEGGSYIYVVSTVVDEDANQVIFTVKLRSPAQEQVSFSYDTEGEGGVISATALQGLDYQPFSGTITFAPGEQEKQITVPLLDDDSSEGNEFFHLFIKDSQTLNSIVSGVAVLKDNELQPVFPTTIPLNEGPSDQTQEQAGGTPGVVRGILDWENPSAQLELILRFTGEDGECDIRLSSAQDEARCDDRLGIFEASPNRSEIIWPSAAPAGFYRFIVQHVSGEASDYNLRLFVDDESLRFSGTIADGASVEVYAFDFEGAVSESSSSSESTESSSEASSEENSSLLVSSSSAEASSSIASSSIESSSSPQSSSESTASSSEPLSSSSLSSSEASSSLPPSPPKPERDLLVQLDDLENSYISVPSISLTGTVVFDPLFPLEELNLIVDFRNSEQPVSQISLADIDWSAETGQIDGQVNLSAIVALGQEFDLQLEARDTDGRVAISENILEMTFLNAPNIELTLPEEQTYFGGQVEVRGQVFPDPLSPNNEVLLLIQNPGEDAPQTIQMGLEGNEFFWYLPADMSFGAYRVWATVEDASGQIATSDVVNFEFAQAGAINVVIEQPEESLIELYPGATSEVIGEITQSANVPIASASLNISRLVGEGGEQEPVVDINLLASDFWNPETQAFNFLLDPQAESLTDGFYNLFINAADSAGNSGDASFSFEYFTPIQPSLTVDAPTQTTYVLSVPVSAQATFDERLQATLSGEVSVEGDVVETLSVPLVENSSIDMQIDTLSPGTYGLSLTLQDSAGQTSVVDDLSFSVRAPSQPLVQIQTPEVTAEPDIVFDDVLSIEGSLVLDDTAFASSLLLTLNHFNSESSFELELDLLAAEALNTEDNSFAYTLNSTDQGIENGVYRGTVAVTDSYGAIATESFLFEFYSPEAPTVDWINIPEGRYADVAPINFAAQVTWDERLLVSAEALWTRTQGEGSFESAMALQLDAENTALGTLNPPSEPGQYELFIRVEDSHGQTAQTAPAFFEVYAADGPVISLQSPELINGAFTTVKPQLSVQGSVALEPDSSLSAFDLQVLQGDSVVDRVSLLANQLYSPESGSFAATLNLNDLLDGYGAVSVQLIAQDSLGLDNDLSFLVNYEQPSPTSITIQTPVENAPYYTTPRLTGYFEIDPRLTYRRLDVVLLYDGDESELNTNDLVLDGQSFNADLGDLPPGAYIVYMEIEDELGNVASSGVNFTIRPVVDVALDWVDPEPSEEPVLIFDEVLALSALIDFDRVLGLQSLDLIIAPVADESSQSQNLLLDDIFNQESGAVNYPLDLSALDFSTNTLDLILVAETQFGTYESDTLRINYIDAPPPQLSLSAPAQGDDVYFSDIAVIGQVSADPQLSLTASATLFFANDEGSEPTNIPVFLESSEITGSIPTANLLNGNYRLDVMVEDQYGRVSNIESVEFNYAVPQASIDIFTEESEAISLFSTGVDNVGNPLELGEQDSHFIVLETETNAVTLSAPNSGYLPNSQESQWIWENADGTPVNVTRTFRTTFELNQQNPSDVVVHGRWSVDNTGVDILINGQSTGNTASGFSAFYDFQISSGFMQGTNTLDFVVQDVGAVSAFRAELVSVATALVPGSVIETVEPFDLYSRVQLSHPQLAVNNFALEVLQAGQWVEQQTFSITEAEWDGENARFNLDYSALGYGSYPSRIRVYYGSGFSEVSGVFNVGYRQTELPTVDWINSPAGFYLTPDSISFSAQASSDEALNITNARVVIEDASSGQEIREITEFGREGQAYFGQLDEPLAEGDYLWTFEVTDKFDQTGRSETVLVQIREPDDLLLVLQSPILENGQYASVKPALNISGEIRHDENTSLTSLQLAINYGTQGGTTVVDADLLELNLYDQESGAFSFGFNVNNFDFGEGTYSVTVNALDGVGNSEVVAFDFIYSEALLPELEITNPIEQRYFDLPSLEGRYSLDPELNIEAFTAVLLYPSSEGLPDSVSLELEYAEGSFSADLPQSVSSGSYSILVSLTDELGNNVSDTVNFEYFIANPSQVELLQPVAEEGDFFTINPLIPFSGSVTLDDFVTLQSLEAVLVTSDGQEYEQNLLEIDGALQGSFFSNVWDLESLGLSSGRYELYVRASTNVDEVASNSLFVDYIEAEEPSVEIITPNVNQTYFSDISVDALASYDENTSIVVNAQYRAINGDASSPMLQISVDGQNINGLIPITGLLPGEYELSVFVEDGFGQRSPTETVQFNYQIPAANINLIHDHAENDGVIDLINTLYVEAEITLEDPSQAINSLSVQLMGEGGWYSVDTYENLEVLNWDGSSAFISFDFAAHDLSFGVYDWRVQINYANNLVESSDPLRVNYRDIQPIQLDIIYPASTNYFAPIQIEGLVQGDPLLDLQLSAILFDQNEESEQTVALTRNGESFSGPSVSEFGDYLLEVYANYPGQDPTVTEVEFSVINAIASIELTHQMPVFDGAIDAVDPLFLVGNVTLSDDRIPVGGFAIEILQGEQWIELQTFTDEQADFGGNQAYFNVDLRQYNLDLGVYDLRARMDYAATLSVYSQPILVNYRDLSPFTVEIVSPQNGSESEEPLDLSIQYATDRLAAPVQLSGQISNSHDEAPLSLPAIPLFEQFAGQFSFEVPADSLRWGENRISIGGVDNRNRQAAPSVITINYLLSSPVVEILDELLESDGVHREGFTLPFNYALDEKLPAPNADSNAAIVVAIEDERVEKSVTQTPDGLWQVDFVASDFSEGDQTILITVIDPRDDSVQGSAEYNFEFNHRPQVTINAPVSVEDQELPYFTDVDVEFEASIGTDGQVATMDVYLNGGEYLVQQSALNGFNRFTIPAGDLIWGDGEYNELSIQVFSANGVASNLSTVVFEYYRPANPTVVIEAPVVDEGGVYSTYNPTLSFSGSLSYDPFSSNEVPVLEALLLEPASTNVVARQNLSGNIEFDVATGNGVFKGAIQLDNEQEPVDYGQYTLQLQVTDSFNTASDQVEIDYLEAAQPTVEILSPNAGSTLDADFWVVADIDWQRPLTATINAELTSVGADISTRIELDLQLDEGGNYSTQIPTANLQSGNYNIRVSVEDSIGQSAEGNVEFTYREPSPLRVEIIDPLEVDGVVSTIGPILNISGYVYHDLARPISALELSFDPTDPDSPSDPLQQRLEFSSTDEEGVVYFSTQINLRTSETSSGTYDLAVTATDELNRESRDSVVVRYRVPELTTVEIVSPQSPEGTMTGSINVASRVITDQEVVADRVYGEVIYTVPGTNSPTVTPFGLQAESTEGGIIYVAALDEGILIEGINEVRVYAEDSLGDIPSDSILISYRYIQPTQITAVEGQNSSAPLEVEVDYSFDSVNSPVTITRTLTSDQFNISGEALVREESNSGSYYDPFWRNSLYVGGNTIRYTIVDASGFSTFSELTFNHEIYQPYLSNLSILQSNIEWGDAFDLSARISFDSSLPEVQTANGIVASLTVNDTQPRQVTMLPDEGNNVYRLTVNPSWVDPGINNITLEVCDPRVEPSENTCTTRGAEFEITAEFQIQLINPDPLYEYHQFDPPAISGDLVVDNESLNFDSIVMYETDANWTRTNRAPIDLTNCFKTVNGCVQSTNGLSDQNYREIVWTAYGTQGSHYFTFQYQPLVDPRNLLNSPNDEEVVLEVSVNGLLASWDERAGTALLNAQITGDGGPIGAPIQWKIPGEQGFQFEFTIPRSAFPSWGDYQIEFWLESAEYPEYRTPVEARFIRVLSQNIGFVHNSPIDGESFNTFNPPILNGYAIDLDTQEQLVFDDIRIYRTDENWVRYPNEGSRSIVNCYSSRAGCTIAETDLEAINYREIEWSVRGVTGTHLFSFSYEELTAPSLLILRPLPTDNIVEDFLAYGRLNNWAPSQGDALVSAQVIQGDEALSPVFSQVAIQGEFWEIPIPFDYFENGWGDYAVRFNLESVDNPQYRAETYDVPVSLTPPESFFGVNFDEPYFVNNEFTLRASLDPSITLDTMEIYLGGESQPSLIFTDVTAPNGSFQFEIPYELVRSEITTGGNTSMEWRFVASYTTAFDVQTTESSLVYSWGFNSPINDNLTLIMDIFGQVEMGTPSTNYSIFYLAQLPEGNTGEKYVAASDQGQNIYFMDHSSQQTRIATNPDTASSTNDTLRFGPGVRPEDVVIARENNNLVFDLTKTQDVEDFVLDDFRHTIAGFFTNPESIDRVVFDDLTTWDTDEILNRVNAERAQFNAQYAIGGHPVDRQGRLSFGVGSRTPQNAQFTDTKLLVEGEVVEHEGSGTIYYPLEKLEPLLGANQRSRVVELTVEAKYNNIPNRSSVILFLHRGDATYPNPEDSRRMILYNVTDQGTTVANSAGDAILWSGTSGSKTLVGKPGEDNYFYISEKNGADIVQLPDARVPSNSSFGRISYGFTITSEDMRFVRPIESDDLYISQTSKNPSMWQIVPNYYFYEETDRRPLYAMSIYDEGWLFVQTPADGQWTSWLNRDDPSGDGDFETKDDLAPDCNAVAMEARLIGGQRTYLPGSNTPDSLVTFDVERGLQCRDADQDDSSCEDYEVRFLCTGPTIEMKTPRRTESVTGNVDVSGVVTNLVGAADIEVFLNGNSIDAATALNDGSFSLTVTEDEIRQYNLSSLRFSLSATDTKTGLQSWYHIWRLDYE